MENFKITTKQVINSEIELPQFFRVGELNYVKLLNDNIHLHVSKGELMLELYPDIKIKPNRVLYWFENHNWNEVTEEEFLTAYFETKYLIENLGIIL
jgi:hypothetical protein